MAIGEGSGGSRSATLGGSAVMLATEKIVDKAKAIAAHMLEAAEADIDFADGVFAIAGTDRTVPLADIAAEAWDPKSLPDGMEPGLVSSAAYAAKEQNFPNGVPYLRTGDRPGDRRGRASCATASSTMSAR